MLAFLTRTPATPQPMKARSTDAAVLAEYERAASAVGVDVPDLTINRFVAVLEKLDLPIYSLPEVVKYMNAKAKREGTGRGWVWRPLRGKDRLKAEFGDERETLTSWICSDYYGEYTPTYDLAVPLHALQRVAAVESAYHQPAHFFVSDYATEKDRKPDPFLMVLVPNPHLDKGIGRFVIDFWDEPGFGIEQMLK